MSARERSVGEFASAWARSRRVQIGPWEVRYREAGNGPTVVLVHGLGISADYWWRNAVPLAAAGFRVLAPDLPGFGRTEGPRGGLSLAEQADALAEWAAVLGIGRAVFVGHSISCQALLELAVERPALVSALILIGPTGAPVRWRMLRQAWRLLVDAFREEPALIPQVALDYLRAGPRRYWGTWRGAAAQNPLELLPRVGCPVAVVVGSRDPVVEPGFARALAHGVPEGRLIRIPDAAHAAQWDRPEAFNREVAGFLRDCRLGEPGASAAGVPGPVSARPPSNAPLPRSPSGADSGSPLREPGCASEP